MLSALNTKNRIVSTDMWCMSMCVCGGGEGAVEQFGLAHPLSIAAPSSVDIWTRGLGSGI